MKTLRASDIILVEHKAGGQGLHKEHLCNYAPHFYALETEHGNPVVMVNKKALEYQTRNKTPDTPLRIKGRASKRQAHLLCKNLLALESGLSLDCMQAMRLMRSKYGLQMDHHEYSTILESMCHEGTARIKQPKGFTVYEITA